MKSSDAECVIEAALMSSPQPLSIKDLFGLFDEQVGVDSIKRALRDLQTRWTGRGVALVEVATGWRFQTEGRIRPFLDRLHPEKPPKYSRATLETLAIIAYRQPVTRGDIEDIRGVVVNSALLKQLEERGWIEVIGHRDTVGRPALLATTRQFLDDLGLQSLDQLPAIDVLEQQLSDDLLPTDATLPLDLSLDADSAPVAPSAAEPPENTDHV
ncbi:SMC-Scp complex subunit ScpB [Hydrogenophaga soli]|nr:SMC-Scp complex subunit ScpB [Burkholderiaceae bacterium]